MTTNDYLEASGIDISNDDNNVSALNDNANSTEPVIDMGDTTGSNGGPAQDRTLGELDNTVDSSYAKN